MPGGGDTDELRMLETGVAEPWFVALVLVGFDIDKGQVVESCVPEFTLTDAEREAICFHSMPDSAAGGTGREDALFSFRVPRRGGGPGAASASESGSGSRAESGAGADTAAGSGLELGGVDGGPAQALSSADSDGSRSTTSSAGPPAVLRRAVSASPERASISSRRLLLAHSLFRQAPDPSSPRGSFQKALVLVTSTPYLTLPHMLLTALADDAFVFGDVALKRAVTDAAQWPDPRAQFETRALKLRLLESELTVSLPDAFLSSFAAPQAAVRAAPGDDDGFASTRGANCTSMGKFSKMTRNSLLLDSSSPISSSDPGEAQDEIPAPDLHRHRDGSGVSWAEQQKRAGSHLVGGGGGGGACGGGSGTTSRGGGSRRQDERLAALKGHPGASEAALVRCWPACMPSSNPTAPPFHEIDIMRALSGVHDRIWALWELVALGEPLVVLAPTPSQCSSAVLAVMSLIHPLPFVGDWRPYFCIQDIDYPRFAGAESISQVLPRGAVFGVTSPHVLQTLKFPHVLTVSGTGDRGVNVTYKPGLKSPNRTSLHQSRQLNSLMNTALSARTKRDQNAMAAAAFDVRSCLLERVTRPFLRAFDRYLVPTWGDGQSTSSEPYASDPFGRGLSLLNFSPECFPDPEDLAAPGVLALFKSGTVSRTRARGFYRRFTSGPVFSLWWRPARAAAMRGCAEEHRKHMLEACARGVGVRMTRLGVSCDPAELDETVDLCLRLRSELAVVPPADTLLKAKLGQLLGDVRAALPEELMGSVGKMPTLPTEDIRS